MPALDMAGQPRTIAVDEEFFNRAKKEDDSDPEDKPEVTKHHLSDVQDVDESSAQPDPVVKSERTPNEVMYEDHGYSHHAEPLPHLSDLEDHLNPEESKSGEENTAADLSLHHYADSPHIHQTPHYQEKGTLHFVEHNHIHQNDPDTGERKCAIDVHVHSVPPLEAESLHVTHIHAGGHHLEGHSYKNLGQRHEYSVHEEQRNMLRMNHQEHHETSSGDGHPIDHLPRDQMEHGDDIEAHHIQDLHRQHDIDNDDEDVEDANVAAKFVALRRHQEEAQDRVQQADMSTHHFMLPGGNSESLFQHRHSLGNDHANNEPGHARIDMAHDHRQRLNLELCGPSQSTLFPHIRSSALSKEYAAQCKLNDCSFQSDLNRPLASIGNSADGGMDTLPLRNILVPGAAATYLPTSAGFATQDGMDADHLQVAPSTTSSSVTYHHLSGTETVSTAGQIFMPVSTNATTKVLGFSPYGRGHEIVSTPSGPSLMWSQVSDDIAGKSSPVGLTLSQSTVLTKTGPTGQISAAYVGPEVAGWNPYDGNSQGVTLHVPMTSVHGPAGKIILMS